MFRGNIVVAAILVIAVSACQPSALELTKELKRQAGQSRIVLMPPDVELAELDAGGLLEPKADWTNAAKANFAAALREERDQRKLTFIEYDEEKLPADRRAALHQASKLYAGVGQSIFIHQYPGDLQLPTKKGRFDWSIGPSVRVLREQYGADYALLTYIRDSYSSGGRVAMQIVGAIAGIGVPGGVQLGFVSLVDLETGDIVWYNRVVRGVGDLRDPSGAKETAEALLKGFPK